MNQSRMIADEMVVFAQVVEQNGFHRRGPPHEGAQGAGQPGGWRRWSGHWGCDCWSAPPAASA